MSFSIKLGNFLYKNAFGLYKPLYTAFKNHQDGFEIELLKKHIRPGAVVLDIGANIGFYASLISGLAGEKGKVYCFEPDQTNFSHLKNSVKKLKNVEIVNKAVGPKTESLKIYTSPNLNVDHRTYRPEKFDTVIEVEAISIDDFVSEKGLNGIDLIKMDIQGFEMQAIMGMHRTLEQNPSLVLISELWPYGLRSAGSSAVEYYHYLTENKFSVYLLAKNQLQKLERTKIEELNSLGEEHYFNILALPMHV